MTIIVNHEGFLVDGDVSFENVLVLRKQGENEIAKTQSADCTIDLRAMKDCDASSVSLLLCWIRYSEKLDKKIKFIHASASFKRMQELFGLKEIIHI